MTAYMQFRDRVVGGRSFARASDSRRFSCRPAGVRQIDTHTRARGRTSKAARVVDEFDEKRPVVRLQLCGGVRARDGLDGSLPCGQCADAVTVGLDAPTCARGAGSRTRVRVRTIGQACARENFARVAPVVQQILRQSDTSTRARRRHCHSPTRSTAWRSSRPCF